ncbi:MAG: glycosyl hydrolase family 18 protein [Ktedonobacteraceae bacterium]
MKRCQYGQLFMVCMLFLVAACSNETRGVSLHTTPLPSRQARQATPTAAQVEPGMQQALPKGLLNPKYPVMDWVFSITCGQAINAYSSSQMQTAIAYDSAAWLYPSDGHLVEGWQDCDNATLIRQARNQGLPALLTVGVDSHWSGQDLAQYIDQAASQAQVPCTSQATTFICTIVNWAIAGGYTGVIIDFESVKGDYPNIRMKFAMFMQELQNALHQKGLLCGLTLIHKVSDRPEEDPSYLGNFFQDWKLLSKVDFLVVMVLDFDLSLKKPGPLTSIAWLDKQLDYLWRTMPQALSKTIFEFPLYGREWQQDAQGKWHPITDETCQQVNVQKDSHTLLPDVSTDATTPVIAWNDQSGNQHQVWYDTPSSLVTIMAHLQEKARGLLNNPHYELPTSFWYRGAECAHFFGPHNALERFYNS